MTNNPVPPERPHVYAFSTKRLVLLASVVLLLVAFSLMLGIRIERYQQSAGVVPPRTVQIPDPQPAAEGAAVGSATKPHVSATPKATAVAPAKKEAKAQPPPSAAPKIEAKPTPAPKPVAQPKPKPKPKPAPKPEPKKVEPVKEPEPVKKAPEPKPAQQTSEPATSTPKKEAPRGHYSIQLESSQDKTKATMQVELLKSKGYAAYLETVDLKDRGRFYRIMVGPFQTKEKAKEIQRSLAKDSRFTDSLIRYVP